MPVAWVRRRRFYLAAAGVGTLVLADDDVVDRSNLQRQILHTDARIGTPKVESARIALSALNPQVNIETFPERITADNVERLIADADVVIDGADNFPVRYLLNDACVKLGKPLVYGAVHRFEGQVSVFDAGRKRGAGAVLPLPVPGAAAAGGRAQLRRGRRAGRPAWRDRAVAGHRGHQADPGQRRSVDRPLAAFRCAWRMRFRETRLRADPHCPVCAADQEFPGYIDYVQFCGAHSP